MFVEPNTQVTAQSIRSSGSDLIHRCMPIRRGFRICLALPFALSCTPRVTPVPMGAPQHELVTLTEQLQGGVCTRGTSCLPDPDAVYRHPDLTCREIAAKCLRRLGSAAVLPLADELGRAPHDHQCAAGVVRVRSTIARNLGLLDDKRAADALIAEIQRDGGDSRAAAVSALARVGPPEASEIVASWLVERGASDEESHRNSLDVAALALARLNRDESVSALRVALQGMTPQQRCKLWRPIDDDGMPVLVDIYTELPPLFDDCVVQDHE